MKKYFYLFLILPVLVFGQQKNYDYFVQFNTQQFAKKANMDSLFNDKAFKNFNKESAKLKLNDFMSFVDKSKPVIIHGNFTDSIPYYQISLPLIDDKGMQQFVQRKIDEAKANDSIVETIKSYPKCQIYSPKSDSYTLAWNKKNLVVYGVFDAFPKNDYKGFEIDTMDVADAVVDTAAVAEEYVVDTAAESAESAAEAIVEDAVQAAEVAQENEDSGEESEDDEEYNEEYYTKLAEENEKERELERIEKQAKQEAQVALLFEKGFVMPVSDKINSKADISAWLNYSSISSSLNSFRYLYRFMPSAKAYETEHDIKGMNTDFYFENDKARIEQTIEYSEPLAKIVSKVISGKPNKNIFKHFPIEAPLAYMSYHVNTEEALKNYPRLTEQALSNLPLEKQDVEIITDLFTTIVDEKATASLFDGDLSVFLHNIESYTEKVSSTTYNEDYEEVVEEKVITKSRPIFSVMMTSTHPTMTEKLLDLGVRKKALLKENNYYVINKSSAEFGSIVLLKEGDVFIITNGLKYLNNGLKSDFAMNTKKEMAKNFISGNMNITDFIKKMMEADESSKDTEKIAKLSKQFKNLQFKSSKKLKENKLKFEMEFNSNYADQNIILQSLDLFNYLNKE